MIQDQLIQQDSDMVRTGSDGRIRYTREQREKVLDLFEASGMSGKAFAEKHGIKYPTFAYWRKARRESAELGQADGSNTQAFLLAQIPPGSGSGPALEVKLPGGAVATASNPEQARLLAELIKQLERS